MGKWVRAADGDVIALDHIAALTVRQADGPDVYEVRAYAVGGWRAVLFSHRSRAVCHEWLERFVAENLTLAEATDGTDGEVQTC
jgi:hypothetical protein